MTDRYKAKAGFIAASALWGTLSVFVKNIELSSAGVALCRAVLAVVVIGAWLLLTGALISTQTVKNLAKAIARC